MDECFLLGHQMASLPRSLQVSFVLRIGLATRERGKGGYLTIINLGEQGSSMDEMSFISCTNQ